MAKKSDETKKFFERMREIRELHAEVETRLDRAQSETRRLASAASEAKGRLENFMNLTSGRIPEHRKEEHLRLKADVERAGSPVEAARKDEKQLTQDRDSLAAELSRFKAQALVALRETFSPANLAAFVMEILAGRIASIRALEAKLQKLVGKRQELSGSADQLKEAAPALGDDELLTVSVDDHAGRLEVDGVRGVACEDLLDRINAAILKNQRLLDDERTMLASDLKEAVDLQAGAGEVVCAEKLKEVLDLDSAFKAAVADLSNQVISDLHLEAGQVFGTIGVRPVRQSLLEYMANREYLLQAVKIVLSGPGNRSLAGEPRQAR